MTTAAPAPTAAAPATDTSRYPKPYYDPAMSYETVRSSYQHLWGGYLALAGHFEVAGDTEQAAIYNEKYRSAVRFELDLWKLSDEEIRVQETEVLPLLTKEVHAMEEKFLGR